MSIVGEKQVARAGADFANQLPKGQKATHGQRIAALEEVCQRVDLSPRTCEALTRAMCPGLKSRSGDEPENPHDSFLLNCL